MGKKNHRNYTPEFKIQLLKKHLVEKVTVSAICEQNHFYLSMFGMLPKQGDRSMFMKTPWPLATSKIEGLDETGGN